MGPTPESAPPPEPSLCAGVWDQRVGGSPPPRQPLPGGLPGALGMAEPHCPPCSRPRPPPPRPVVRVTASGRGAQQSCRRRGHCCAPPPREWTREQRPGLHPRRPLAWDPVQAEGTRLRAGARCTGLRAGEPRWFSCPIWGLFLPRPCPWPPHPLLPPILQAPLHRGGQAVTPWGAGRPQSPTGLRPRAGEQEGVGLPHPISLCNSSEHQPRGRGRGGGPPGVRGPHGLAPELHDPSPCDETPPLRPAHLVNI